MKHLCWLSLALLFSPIARSQEYEKVQPAGRARNPVLSKPVGVAREVAAAGRDFAEFRDPQWSVLTIAQIGAASADAVTSLNDLHRSPRSTENGIPRLFVGGRPDAHKYIIAGTFEIGIEAVAAHYFRVHGPVRKWYWRALWTLPQSLSLYEHARASQQNTALNLK